eukprot:7319400-Pyramimonas_sp.AAC.1
MFKNVPKKVWAADSDEPPAPTAPSLVLSGASSVALHEHFWDPSAGLLFSHWRWARAQAAK